MKIFVDEDIEERYAQGLYEDYLKEQIEQKDKEIERLNNIINELHKLIEQDWDYYGSFVYNSRAEFDDEEQVNKFWQDYGKKEIVKKYRDKIKELKGDSSNE